MWTAKGDAGAHCYKVLPSGHILTNISENQFGLLNSEGILQWQFRYPKNAFPRFHLSPENDIIVTCPAQKQQKAAYVCVNLAGEAKWQFTVFDTSDAGTRLPYNFHGNGHLSPNAFFQFWNHLIFAVSETGAVNWVSDSLLLAYGEAIEQIHLLPNLQGIAVVVSTPEKNLRFYHVNPLGRVQKLPALVNNVTQIFPPLPKDPLDRGFWLGFSTSNGTKTALAFFSWDGHELCRVQLGEGLSIPSGQCDTEGNFYYPHAFHPKKQFTLFRKINPLGEVLQQIWIPGYIQKPPAIFKDRLVIADEVHELLWGFNTDFQKTWGPYCPYFSLLGTNLSGRTLWELGQPEFLPNGNLIYGVMAGKHAGKIFCMRPPDIEEQAALPNTATDPLSLEHKYD